MTGLAAGREASHRPRRAGVGPLWIGMGDCPSEDECEIVYDDDDEDGEEDETGGEEQEQRREQEGEDEGGGRGERAHPCQTAVMRARF